MDDKFRSTLDPDDSAAFATIPREQLPFASWLTSLFCWDGALPAFMLTFPYLLALTPLEVNARMHVAFWLTVVAIVIRLVIVRRQLRRRFPETRGVRFFVAGIALIILGMIEGINGLLAQQPAPPDLSAVLIVFAIAYAVYLFLMALATISLPKWGTAR